MKLATRTPVRAVLVNTMVVAVFLTFLMFQTRTVAETMGGVDTVRALRGATLLGIGGLAVLLSVIANDIGWIRGVFTPPLRWYALYVTWALVSVAYSGDWFLSLAKVFELSVSVVVILAIAHWYRTPDQLDLMWRTAIGCLGLVAMGYFVVSILQGIPLFTLVNGVPKYAGFGGGPGGANGLTQIGAILGLFAVSRTLEKDSRAAGYFVLALVAIALMFVSYSRTSIALFVLLLWLLLVRSRQLGLALVMTVGGVLAVVAVGATLFEYLLRGQELETFISLTGRIDFLWVAGLAVFAMSPVIGHGFYYGTTYYLPLFLFGGYNATISNVDNSFLEVALNLGSIGLALFTILWIAAMRNTWIAAVRFPGLWRLPMVREGMLVLISTFVRSWINPTIVYHHWNTFMFLLASIIVVRAIEGARHGDVEWRKETAVARP